MIIGLTGGIGSGKSLALSYFQKLKIDSISADSTVKKVIDEDECAKNELIKLVGKEIIDSNEAIDRKILREKIFNDKILKPWERDPAFYKSIWTYKSDVPAHEGPTHHAIIELWQYKFPLNKNSQKELASSLAIIPRLNKEARINLTGNAKDLWIAGIRDIKNQSKVLLSLIHI